MKQLLFMAAVFLLAATGVPARASLNSESFARDFQTEASKTYSFTAAHSASFYKKTDDRGYGVRLNGILDVTDKTASANFGGFKSADLERNSKLTTMLLSGTYDLPVNPQLAFRPYVLVGAGLAVYDTTAANMLPEERGTSLVPVFKLGGGLAFRMDQKMDLTFSYKSGFASPVSSTSRSSDDAAMQMVDVALKYKF